MPTRRLYQPGTFQLAANSDPALDVTYTPSNSAIFVNLASDHFRLVTPPSGPLPTGTLLDISFDNSLTHAGGTVALGISGAPNPFGLFTDTAVYPSEDDAFALTGSVSATPAPPSSRTFVSTFGNDANMSLSCSAAANCRTFAAALSVTNPGGEVVVVNSGGYGPATISQPIVITAVGVDASISATTGANGITINTAGSVTLSGLGLHGEATGNDGILIQQVGLLRLYNLLIENFTNDGIHFGHQRRPGGVWLQGQ
jgi:hypothetical protein